MKIGDRVQLINEDALKKMGIHPSKCGQYGKVIGQSIPYTSWCVRLDNLEQWYVTEDCIRLIEMKSGDKIILINQERLNEVNLGRWEGMRGMLDIPMTSAQIVAYSQMRGENGWWVQMDGCRGYVPISCIKLVEPTTCSNEQDLQSTTTVTTIKQKEQNTMLYIVRVLRKTSVKAQEAGEVESILVPATEIVANDGYAAAFAVGAANTAAINGVKSPELKVIVKEIG